MDKGHEVAIVVGAGNIWRGRTGGEMDRTNADRMGMLATVINCICVKDALVRVGAEALVMTAIPMYPFAELYSADAAKEALSGGKIVIFGAGMGVPFLSTDTAAALRAAELGADAVLMAKNIDGIYTADPKKDPSAKRYDEITYKEIVDKELKALDLTAATFCMDNDIKCYAFELKDPMNIYRVTMGEKIGTELHR
jgi:uridylate kinase